VDSNERMESWENSRPGSGGISERNSPTDPTLLEGEMTKIKSTPSRARRAHDLGGAPGRRLLITG